MIETCLSAPDRRKKATLRPLIWRTRAILIHITAVVLLLGSSLLLGEARRDPISGFHLSVPEVLKFATSFGLAEASTDTVEKVLQLSLSTFQPTLKNLIAFEENRHFVYALVKLSETASPDSPRYTRRLIFLKPSTFVLDDEIQPGFAAGANWSLESRAQPTISGRVVSLKHDKHELICETLFPEAAARQIQGPRNADKLRTYVLQVRPKQPSEAIRFLHVLQVHRRERGISTPRTQFLAKRDALHLTIQTSQQTYQLVVPSARAGTGEIEITSNEGKTRLNRRFFPAGVLPHGREGLKLMELWDASYRGGKRPFWDAGQPSGELRRVVEQGIIRPGTAVDLGCGSGTDAIYLASKGFDVTAIDIAPTALSLARDKADRAGVKVRWLLASVLSLPKLEPFDFIFDRGCYHEVRFENATTYVETVQKLSEPGRTRFLLLAGNPNEAALQYAPPQVAEEDIRSDFSTLFDFEWLQEARFETSNPAARGPLAWSVMLRRKAQP